MHYSITLAHQHFRNGKFQEAKIIYSELAKKHQTKIYDHNIALCDQYIKESNTVENGKGVLLNSPEKQIDVKSQTPVQERINGISYVEKRVKSFECDPIEGRKYKVSIVMPTYNNAKYIKQSIESLLNQTYSNIEILVVDDHSDDNTMEVVRSLKDERIKYYRLNCNLGTYFARSYGMFYSTGDYITFQDSDDFSHSKRIELHLSNMLKDGRLISTSTYIRVDGEMNIVQMHGKNERYALISLMFHKTLLGKAGYYDITTRGGDAEYELRIRRFIHKNQAIHIPVPTYIARSLDGSLTSGEINLSAQNDAQALSDERALYIAGVQNLLPSFNLLNIKDAFNFPMLRSPYHTSGVLDTSNIPEKIIGCVCVIPERLEIFKSVFASIISQVDTLFIFLDKMSEIPPFLNHPKVKCQFTQEYGDIADGGKFMPLIDNRFSGDVNDDDIYFTFDDDIVYPLDYVHSMYKSLKKYSFTAVCGLHGSIMNENFTSHRKDRVVLHFLKSLEKDTFVDILGTGTTCFKVSLIKNKITQNDITPRMIDIGFSKIGKDHCIPFVSVKRNAQWLVDVSQDTPTLFDEMKIDDAPHTAILKESHVVGYGKAAIDANFINNSFSFEDTLTQSYENIKLNTRFLRVFFKNDKKIIRLNLQVGKKGKCAVEVQNAVTSKTIFQKNTDENGIVVFLINTSVNSCVNIVFERDIDSVSHMTATVVQDVSAPRELYKDDKAITACLATYPPRETCLQDVVESTAMKVDNFCLYLNKYEQVPSCVDVQNNRIHFILDQDGRPKASGKFRWIDTEGYIFILDDDIIYPQDYFSYLIAHIETFERKAFVGVHGVIFEEMISSDDEHIKSCMKSKFNFSQALSETQKVNMIGTGTLAFHSSLIEGHVEELYNLLNFDKRTANANDEALAVFAKKYNMPMYIVSRQEGWLKNNKKMKYGIHEEHFNDSIFTKSVVDLLAEGNPWTLDIEKKSSRI